MSPGTDYVTDICLLDHDEKKIHHFDLSGCHAAACKQTSKARVTAHNAMRNMTVKLAKWQDWTRSSNHPRSICANTSSQHTTYVL